MRVICNTVDEFLDDLGRQDPDCLIQKCIRVTTTKNHIDGLSKRDATKFTVNFQASAVVALPVEGEYLLEVGVDCGIDYHDSTQSYEGSEEADILKNKIRSFCDENGLDVRPGIIDI